MKKHTIMITKEELRIGNWFYSEKTGWGNKNIQQVETIGRNGVNHWQDMGASGEILFGEMQPISFSVEWLESAGYAKGDIIENRVMLENGGYGDLHGYTIYEKDKFQDIAVLGNEFEYIIDVNTDDYADHYTTKKIFFVHQFQNLFFELNNYK